MNLKNGINMRIEKEIDNDKDVYKINLFKNYFGYHDIVPLVDDLISDLQDVLNELEQYKYRKLNNKDLDIGR